MQGSELRALTDEELAAKQRELRDTLFVLRLRHGTKQLESPARLRQTKRDIARVRTIQRQRALAAKRE